MKTSVETPFETDKSEAALATSERSTELAGKKRKPLPISLGAFGLMLIALGFCMLCFVQVAYIGRFSLNALVALTFGSHSHTFSHTMSAILIVIGLILIVSGSVCSIKGWIGDDGREFGVIGTLMTSMLLGIAVLWLIFG